MNSFRKSIATLVVLTFVAASIAPYQAARASQGVPGLPLPGTMVNLSSAYVPLLLKGVHVHPENPLLFDFIVDTGNTGFKGDSAAMRAESERQIKYFLATLTIPEKDLWVNLSPYEKDRVIEGPLGQTELGRDMLAQDYILKQLTASLIYPEKEMGKKFWDKVYDQVREKFGANVNIPVNTFNKVWILPDQADIVVRNNTAFVVRGHMKVMLEEDYFAVNKHAAGGAEAVSFARSVRGSMASSPATPRGDGWSEDKRNSSATGPAHAIATQGNHLTQNLIRQIVLPQLEREVNEGKHFAPLRQIFNAIVLASWYKKNMKEALLNQVYADKSKINGVNADDPAVKEKIYQQYLQAYKKGVFNYIKETSTPNGAMVPRKYFSGGENWAMSAATGARVLMDIPRDNAMAPAGNLNVIRTAVERKIQDQAMMNYGEDDDFVSYDGRIFGQRIESVRTYDILKNYEIVREVDSGLAIKNAREFIAFYQNEGGRVGRMGPERKDKVSVMLVRPRSGVKEGTSFGSYGVRDESGNYTVYIDESKYIEMQNKHAWQPLQRLIIFGLLSNRSFEERKVIEFEYAIHTLGEDGLKQLLGGMDFVGAMRWCSDQIEKPESNRPDNLVDINAWKQYYQAQHKFREAISMIGLNFLNEVGVKPKKIRANRHSRPVTVSTEETSGSVTIVKFPTAANPFHGGQFETWLRAIAEAGRMFGGSVVGVTRNQGDDWRKNPQLGVTYQDRDYLTRLVVDGISKFLPGLLVTSDLGEGNALDGESTTMDLIKMNVGAFASVRLVYVMGSDHFHWDALKFIKNNKDEIIGREIKLDPVTQKPLPDTVRKMEGLMVDNEYFFVENNSEIIVFANERDPNETIPIDSEKERLAALKRAGKIVLMRGRNIEGVSATLIREGYAEGESNKLVVLFKVVKQALEEMPWMRGTVQDLQVSLLHLVSDEPDPTSEAYSRWLRDLMSFRSWAIIESRRSAEQYRGGAAAIIAKKFSVPNREISKTKLPHEVLEKLKEYLILDVTSVRVKASVSKKVLKEKIEQEFGKGSHEEALSLLMESVTPYHFTPAQVQAVLNRINYDEYAPANLPPRFIGTGIDAIDDTRGDGNKGAEVKIARLENVISVPEMSGEEAEIYFRTVTPHSHVEHEGYTEKIIQKIQQENKSLFTKLMSFMKTYNFDAFYIDPEVNQQAVEDWIRSGFRISDRLRAHRVHRHTLNIDPFPGDRIFTSWVNQVLPGKLQALATKKGDDVKAQFEARLNDIWMNSGNLRSDIETLIEDMKTVYDAAMANPGDSRKSRYDAAKAASPDNAQAPGGIDMKAAGKNTSVSGEKVNIRFDKAMINQFERGDFSGVRPVILGVTEIPSVLPLLGLAPRREEELARG